DVYKETDTMCTVTRSTDRGNRSFFILLMDKKRPLLKLQGPGTSKHHIGRHDATVKIIWPDGVQ
ncbi:hypothetical protein, partial [Escherichia coli]|uniref:hypothetical protein n=1 Tax=Escherichia coli TaxID=562 RepID=UPI001E56054C